MPKLIDAHTHAQFAVYGENADDVIMRALDEGTWVVNVGTQRDTSTERSAAGVACRGSRIPLEAAGDDA